jgi:beta-glucanase (GH16 family)
VASDHDLKLAMAHCEPYGRLGSCYSVNRWFVLLLLSVLVVAAACSGEEEGANQGQATGTAEAQTEPAPIAGQGYRLTWSDQFDTLDNSKWEQCWYEPDPGPHNIFVSNGLLHLRMRRVDGYMKASVCSIDLSDNVPYNVFRQGYLEARSRVPVGKGAWSAFWLSSEYHARNWEWPHTCPPYWAEIDIYEMLSNEPHTQYTTLHRNTNGRCGVPDETRPPPATRWMRCDTDRTPCSLQTEFHVYAVKWTPDRVTWFRDGQVVQSTRYHSTIADVSSFDSTDQPSFIVLYTWPCGSGDNCPDSTSPDVLDHQFDWVRVWTR